METVFIAASFIAIGGLIIFMISIGKSIAESKYNKEKNSLLKKQIIEVDNFIRDVDALTKAENEAKSKISSAFKRRSVGDIVRALDERRKTTKAQIANSAR